MKKPKNAQILLSSFRIVRDVLHCICIGMPARRAAYIQEKTEEDKLHFIRRKSLNMKIGLFSDTYYPEINGVATSCLTLKRELTRRGHEVHVFAPKCRGWEEHQEENTHYIASAPFLVLKDRNFAFPSPITSWEATKLDFDIVHTNSEFVMGYFGRHVAKSNGSIRIHTYHTIWEEYTYYVTHGVADEAARKVARKYSKWWCNKVDRIIAPTGKTLGLLYDYGVKTPMDIIPSGMDIARFAPERHDGAERSRYREECGVLEGERVLLNIGRLSKEKNIEQIMRVFPRLHAVHPDVRLVIVGEGPMRENLEKMAKDLGVGSYVTFTGPKPWEKIDSYYAMGDVFVSASRSETQGLTYVEAMASGLCVCAVFDECLCGVIEDGVSGILTDEDDESLLIGLLRAFSPEGTEIARRAPQHARPFSTEVFAERVEACYLRAIEETRR